MERAEGVVIESTGSWYKVEIDGAVYDCRTRGRLRLKGVRSTSPVVVGDRVGVEFSEEIAKEILLESSIDIVIGLNDGEGAATAWGCDLTYDYVKINGDYRT
jgi:translation initiation factor IF-1